MRSAVLSLFVLAAMAWGNAASADTVWATASGDDPVLNTDFWSVEYVSGSKFIAAVAIDLSPTGNYWDFDGSGNYMGATGPVIGARSGLNLSDITPHFMGSNPSLLGFSFAPGSFGPGDYFKWSADFDGVDPDTGDAVAGSTFYVLFEDGTQYRMPYGVIGEYTSRASMPEPGMLALAGCGLLGIALRRRRRRRNAA